jgi:oligopeptide transport system substrate-binding protein
MRSPVALSYLDDIVGVGEFAGGQAEHIAGLRAVDEHTLVIEIDAPKAYFLPKLTYPVALVVNREQVESQGSDWWRKPDGSGPFVLDTLSDDSIVLVRNTRYYGGMPALERVEFTLDGGLPITMYENDRLDIVEVDASEIERVLDPENPLYAEHRVMPELSVDYLGLNTTMPPFDDPAVRQAFAQAIDKDKLADLVLKGTASPARGVLPPGMPGYDVGYGGLPYDPARARELLARSRYGAPGAMPEIALAISGTTAQMPPMTRAIVAMIQENLGIELTVEEVAWGDFLDDMNLRRYQIFSAGWIADYPDPQNFLDILFHSASTQNSTGYSNTQVDGLLEQARVESDHAKRMQLYHEAEQVIVSEAPWIPLTHGIAHVLVKPYVQGYRARESLYPWLKDIALTP